MKAASLSIDSETLRQQELAEKKKRRLERNRASARQCRKRKKEKKLLLRQQLALLEVENLQLRLKLQVDHNNNDSQSAIITTKLNELLTQGASEVEIESKIQELKERFSDYGRDRRSAIDFHVAQLRRCLEPTQTTRAILWLMSLAPRFYEITTGIAHVTSEANELMTLWSSLLDEIKPTPEQRQLMIAYTSPPDRSEDPFMKIQEVTDTCNATLDRIVAYVCNKNDNLDQEMANLQNILSPRQTAKFILWIDRNPACMEMLEALWPHVTQSISTSTIPTTTSSISPTHADQQSLGMSHSTSFQNFSVATEDVDDDDYDESSSGSEN